jgi:hypothetical protein
LVGYDRAHVTSCSIPNPAFAFAGS